MKRIIVLLPFLFLASISLSAFQAPETGMRVAITSGNELYQWCHDYENTVSYDDNRNMRLKSTDTDAVFNAAECLGFVRGVVETLPVGGAFSPGPKVMVSQYVDVIYRYLENHPELRDRRAAMLSREALEQSFPGRG